MRLSELRVGESATVCALLSEVCMRRRLMDIGLIVGTRVTCVGRSPGGDPAAYAIRGAIIAIRDRDSTEVIIKPIERGAPPWG